MAETKKIIPKRRFKEFQNAGEWEQSKLSELTYVYDGTHQTPSYTDKGIMFLSVENIKSMKSNKFISVEDFKEEFKVFPEKGDVLMTRIGDIGTANVYDSDEPVAYYVSLALLKRKELDPYYLKEVIACDTVQKELWHRTLHIAFPKKINKNEIEKVIVPYPKEKLEQEKIGKHFEELDNLITLQQCKLEKIKSMKKAYLYEMFPAEGESKPKRRFKGFTDEWERCKLEDISEIIGGGTPSTTNNDYWDGNIDWYSPAEIDDEQIYVSGSKRKITELGLKNSSAKILPAGKTILFTSRAGIGKTAILRRSGATNQGFQSLILKDEYSTYFIYSMSNQIKEKAEAIASGSTFLEISGKMLGKIEILVPKRAEQDVIAQLFEKMDNLIIIHQSKLDKLKNLKKAYLNEMFI